MEQAKRKQIRERSTKNMEKEVKYSEKDPKCYRIDKNGWQYVHLEGTPSGRGYAYGFLLSEEIIQAITEAKKLIVLQTGFPWEFFKEDKNSIIHSWKRHLESPMYEEYLLELQAITNGANTNRAGVEITVEDLILWNGYEELTDYWFPTVASYFYNNMTAQNTDHSSGSTFKIFHKGADDHCSAFIATGSYTKDRNIVMAHNSFTPFENSNYMNVIVDMVPQNGNSFIMQAQTGFIHSMSDYYETRTGEGKGLMITETTIGGFCAYNPAGAPEFVRIRHAVQYAKTLDEFVELFWKNNNGGYANTWLVGDIGTKEIMRFEAGLKFYKIDKTQDGYFAGFNAPLDPRIRNFECTNSGFADIRRHQGARQVRIPQLMEEYKGRIDNEVAQTILADHFDIYLNIENPSSRTVCSHYELDDRECMSQAGRPLPFQPRGAVDGLCSTSDDAAQLKLYARWGSSCGKAFYADKFLEEHPQFDYLKPFLKDRPSQPWTEFQRGMEG